VDLDKHIKIYLGIAAIIASLYGAWQIFEEYNVNTVEQEELRKEIAQKEKASVATDREIVTAILDTRREAAEMDMDEKARARLYYQEKIEEGTATPADKRRAKYFEEAVPKAEDEVEKLSDKIDELESKE
jgi:hypothetical protein